MTRKFLELFSVNDPGWGNSHSGNGSKDAKDGQGSDQAPKTEPGNPEADKPVETQPKNPQSNPQPAKPDGPPDLDELWRDFNDRISGIFGGKKRPGGTAGNSANKPNRGDILPPSQRGGGGGGGGGFTPPNFNFTNPLSSKTTVLVAVGAVFLIWILNGLFIIQEGQSGVVTTFGKYSHTTGPGINWRMPWPIQAEQIVNVSGVRSVEIGRSVLIKATNQKENKTGNFIVQALQAELTQTRADFQLLNTLSAETNGRFYNYADLIKISDNIVANENIQAISYKNTKLDEFINNKWIFFFILLLFSTEWFIRKWNGSI
jgi:hypothetical protein